MTSIDVRDGVSTGFDSESVAQDSKVGISLEFAMDVTHDCNIRKPNLRKPFTPAPACVDAVHEVFAGLFAMYSIVRAFLNVVVVREPVN